MLFMTLRIALRALMRNKLRAFLTMLGIIIGVGAVIAMVAIGEGAKATIRSQIASLGTNVLIILPGTSVQGGVRTGSGGVNTLVDGDAKAMMRELPAVAFASPALRRNEQIVAGNLNWLTLTQGVGPEFQQIRDWQVAEGRFIHDGDIESAAKVAVVGETWLISYSGVTIPSMQSFASETSRFGSSACLRPKDKRARELIKTTRLSFLIQPCKNG